MFKQPFFWLVLSSALVVTMVTRNIVTDRNELYGHSQDLPEIFNLVDRAYVDQVSMNKLMPGVFQGALDAVDPNASYVAPGNDAEPYWEAVYQKWGLVIARDADLIRILAVGAQSAAAKAGISPGSYLRRIGASSTRQMNAYQVRRDLANWTTPLKLTIYDPVPKKEKELELEPGTCDCTAFLAEKLDGNIIHLNLPHFLTGQTTIFADMVEKLMQTDSKILLDLRNNALGDETYLRELGSLFLDQGEIAQWRAAKSAPVSLLNPLPGTFAQTELYLLVDASTAWAAETFAASAQSRGQAVVLGHPTQGLPAGYEFIGLKNGGFLQFSQRDVVFGDNRVLTRQGITPDWKAPKLDSRTGDPLLENTLAYLRSGEIAKRKAS